MSKVNEFIGIDVSKDYLDVYAGKHEFYQFNNNVSGFKNLLKLTSSKTHCVL
jgi:transposase